MKRFIVSENAFTVADAGKVKQIKPSSFTTSVPQYWADYANEYRPYLIFKDLESDIEAGSIVMIDFGLPSSEKYFIAHQLLSNLEVAVLFFADEVPTNLHREDDNGLWTISSVRVVVTSEMQLLADGRDEELDRQYELFSDGFAYPTYVANFQRSLIYDRHQATNEWGAVKLLLNHGKTLNDIQASFDFPKTVLFSQKLKENGMTANTTLNLATHSHFAQIAHQRTELSTNQGLINKILLIDDHAERGWLAAMNLLFPGKTVNYKKSSSELTGLNFSDYDLIFLDLRLPTNPGDATRLIENGLHLIDTIKTDHASLHVPVIVFTASQKAATMEAVQQKGADAVYIKEAMDTSTEKSPLNYLKLISIINQQLSKGKELKKYNKWINEIKAKLLPQVVDANGVLLKARIIERLEMFYGLLRKSYEETDYEKSMFHFSARTLSFMTLWSILNEIQECFYEKIPYVSASLAGLAPSRSPMDWKIKTTNDYYLRNTISVSESMNNAGNIVTTGKRDRKANQFSTLEIQMSNQQPYSIANRYNSVNTYDQKLSFQIAFLLLKGPWFAGAGKKIQYLTLLKTVNEYRNHLYLTHGEQISSGFHGTLEADKVVNNALTEQFFGLIAFLLTGDENIA